MTDISFALEAKSNQLNAMDIIGCNRVIKITKVDVKKSAEQPVAVHFEGDNNRPWYPSKGMRRVLASAWGVDSSAWIGKYAELFFEPSVMYAGKEVGGIRIKSLSSIPPQGIQCSLTINRQKREPYHVASLIIEDKQYPQSRFEKALPVMADKMASGEMTLQQVIAQCQITGQLTQEQIEELQKIAPIEINEDDENEVM